MCTIEQGFPLGGAITGFIGGTLSYVGDRYGVFNPFPQRELFPAYTRTDFTAGTQWSQWKLNLFLNNAFNTRGLIDGGLGSNIPYDFHFLQPRTVGLNLTKRF